MSTQNEYTFKARINVCHAQKLNSQSVDAQFVRIIYEFNWKFFF